MPPMNELRRAIDHLRSARGRIVAVAADWQARGIDTAPLTPALIDLQEALADAEAFALLAGPPPRLVAPVEPVASAPDRIHPLLLPDEHAPA
jgi:hypothetical protein